MKVLIPLAPRSKRPLVAAWNEVGADTEAWWANAPDDANIGIRTDDLVVIDCDNAEAEERWRSLGYDTPYTVKTGRGRHFYYRRPAECRLRPSPLTNGIDVKTGSGAFVVGPPSVHENGTRYAWSGPELADAADLPPAPLGLIETLRPSKEEIEGGVDNFGAGQRNAALTSLAGALRKHGLNPEKMAKLLLGINEAIVDPPLEKHEVLSIAKSVSRYAPDIELDSEDLLELIMWASAMQLPPPPEWWWKPYIPKSRLVLLDGSEGIGKGMFCVNVAAALTSGAYGDKGRVLWLSAEDDPEEDILRRLYAVGYDGKKDEGIGFITKRLAVPKDVDLLGGLINEHDARLLIMDPGRSFLSPPEGSRDFSFNNEAHVRPGMEELNRLAKRTDCTILFVHHWNKNTQTAIQYRSGGSGAFAQVVRHRVTLAWHGPTEGGSGAFEVGKSNIAPKGHVHGYQMEPVADLDTARFVLTDSLPEYPDLGTWLKECDKEDGISVDYGEALATWCSDNVAVGAPVPGRRALAQEIGVSEHVVREALKELEAAGAAVSGGPNGRLVWRGAQ